MRLFGIAILALGLLRIPLPQADYHQIRHQHGPGEVCAQHDHLLRWHPGTSGDETVAVLHWHWFVPSAEHDADEDEGPAKDAGPAFHAHADGLEPDWVGDLVVQADARGRFIPPPAPPTTALKSLAVLATCLPPPTYGFLHGTSPPCEPVVPGKPPLGLATRWNC